MIAIITEGPGSFLIFQSIITITAAIIAVGKSAIEHLADHTEDLAVHYHDPVHYL